MKNHIRDAILDTAQRMIRRYGIQKTNLDDIARAARVAKATIYNHFGSKEQVYAETLDREIGLLITRITQAMETIASPMEKLKIFLRESLAMAREETLLFTGENAPSHRFLSRIAAAREHFFAAQLRVLKGILEQGAREGIFAAPDVDKATQLIGYVVRGFSASQDERTHTTRQRLEPGEEAASLFQILCYGLTVKERKV